MLFAKGEGVASAETNRSEKLRVLIVDDDVNYVVTLIFLLCKETSQPYEVRAIYDGFDPVRVAEELE
jgi:hypothetical protein